MLRTPKSELNLLRGNWAACLCLLVLGGCAASGGGGGGGYYQDAESDFGSTFVTDTGSAKDSGSQTQADAGNTKPDTSVADESSVHDAATGGQDTSKDSVTDAVKDSVADTAKTDTAKTDTTKTDVAADVPAVDTCGPGHDIASLLQCSEGLVDFQLDGALVTYVTPSGFFVYDSSTTRGMLIYVGTTWPYTKPKVGDEVSVHIGKYASFNGQQEVTLSDALVVTGAGMASTSALNLATVPAAQLGEDYESRLLVGKGLVVKSLNGPDGVVTLPVAGDVTLRVEGTTTLCAGATFELKAGVLTQYNAAFRVQLFNGASDLGSVDTTGCGAAPTYDDSNWGFEEASSADPPPDFYKVGSAITAVRDTADKHGGQASCKVTWTSVDNQDLYAGKLVPVAAGQKATVSVWFKDNDPAGKARISMTFYKADKITVISSQYSTTYTADSATWIQQTFAFAAPVDAAYVKGFVRFYDDKGWAGTASMWLDDWATTVQ